MSNNHPYNPVSEAPYQYYQPSNTRSVAESHSYSSDVARAPYQVPGETKPDPEPPDWPTRPKQDTNHAVTDRAGSLHDSPVDTRFAFEQPPDAIPSNPYKRAYPAHTMQHGALESNSEPGTGHMQQQSLAQYSSSPAASMTASWSSHQSSSTSSPGHSGRETNSRYSQREDGIRGSRMAPTHEANASQSPSWIWSPQYRRHYYQYTNEQGQLETVWAPES